jgi:adenylate cyclase class 2
MRTPSNQSANRSGHKAHHRELEVRFLEIDVVALKKRLTILKAKDLGEDLLEEIIIYDKEGVWNKDGRLLRLRTRNKKTSLTYKNHKVAKVDGTEEIEFEVGDSEKALTLLERLGFVAFRYQQKKRHTFEFNKVTIDIDTWPRIPTYVELEGLSEREIKSVAKELGFDWKRAVFHDARKVIENCYHIPIGEMRYFTFNRFE